MIGVSSVQSIKWFKSLCFWLIFFFLPLLTVSDRFYTTPLQNTGGLTNKFYNTVLDITKSIRYMKELEQTLFW